MNIWLQDWQVGLIGLLVVVAGLVLFMDLRNLLKSNKTKKTSQTEEPGISPDLPVPADEGDREQAVDDPAIVAAITAALHCMLNTQTDTPRGFIVRRIRRVV